MKSIDKSDKLAEQSSYITLLPCKGSIKKKFPKKSLTHNLFRKLHKEPTTICAALTSNCLIDIGHMLIT